MPKWFQKPQLHCKYGQAIKTRTKVQQMLIDKKITSGHAKVLLSSDNQIEAAKDVIDRTIVSKGARKEIYKYDNKVF